MMNSLSLTAMVLAAGIGSRMRPMTLNKPKPLQMVGGKTMLDHALDKLVTAGIKRAVVNTFYLADQIEHHLKTRQDIEIIISRETELLDTGGGIANAIHYFDGKPFFSLNADLPWLDEGTPSLKRMQDFWNTQTMDALLLLMRTEKARGFAGTGDFVLEKNGEVWRKNLPPPRPYVWISAQILNPKLYNFPPARVFSNNYIWDQAETSKRLYGIEHNGTCYHVGTPEDWHLANKLFSSEQGWSV